MPDKKQTVRELYDKSAEVYNSRYKEIQFQKYAIMLSDLVLKQPILDLGCGTGLLQQFLQEKLFGVDISFESLEKSAGTNVQGDIENLPFKEKVFATVLSFTAAQNLVSIERMLKEIRRVLKPDGIAVITILAKFPDKLSGVRENGFEILEVKKCGEDVGLILKPLPSGK